MKNKLTALFLSFALILTTLVGLGSSVHAEDSNVTVQINGATSDTNFKGYRLLTSKTSSDGSIAYAFNDTYKDAVLAAATSVSNSQIKTLPQLLQFLNGNAPSDNSTAYENANVRKFADEVYTRIQNLKADYTFKGGDNTVDYDAKQGYWLLVQAQDNGTDKSTDKSTALLFALTNATMTINVKSSTPTLHKKVLEKNADDTKDYQDAADYSIGDSVPFMITGTISDQIKSFSSYTYKFTDTLPKGLTLDNSSIKVQVEKVDHNGYAKGIHAKDDQRKLLTNNTDYTVSTTTDDSGKTTLTVNMKNLLGLVNDSTKGINPGDTVVVTYNATLNEHAVIGEAGNVNTVKLTYSNDPYSNSTRETTEKNAKVYTYALEIFKTGKDNNALSGAGFTLSKKDGNTYKTIATLNGKGATYVNGIAGTAVLGKQGDVENSKFTFNGLDAGRYKIEETTVPDGYRKADDIEFTIDTSFKNQNKSDAALESLNVKVISNGATFTVNTDNDNHPTGVISTTIRNYSDSDLVLPNTGGYTLYILIAGVTIFILGLISFIRRKRHNEE